MTVYQKHQRFRVRHRQLQNSSDLFRNLAPDIAVVLWIPLSQIMYQ